MNECHFNLLRLHFTGGPGGDGGNGGNGGDSGTVLIDGNIELKVTVMKIAGRGGQGGAFGLGGQGGNGKQHHTNFILECQLNSKSF